MTTTIEIPNISEKEPTIVVHQERIGPMNYRLEAGKEQLESWNNQVDAIHQAIESQNFDQLAEYLKNDKLVERGKKILERAQMLSPEAQDHIKELLAISTWVIDNQNHWPGNWESGFKMIKGGLHRIEHFTRDGGTTGPSCLDMSAIVRAIAQERGIEGQIERLGTKGRGSRFEHRYWRSNKGFTVDTLWGIGTGGVYLSDEEYEERRIARKRERKLGSIGSYNPSEASEDCIEDYTNKEKEAA